ncbi:MAG: C10 family peptidase [Lentimicrobiaceae bacterium]|nr:C10 family peptidase [Lentimicrobiaceae bacterium]
MKKIFTHLFTSILMGMFFLGISIPLQAKKVETDKAISVASYLMEQQFDATKFQGEELILVYTAQNQNSLESQVVYYVFNVGEQGFIIISGDDIAYPVLGYSTQGKYEPDNLPSNFQIWMQDIFNTIVEGISNNLSSNNQIQEEWDAYLNRDADYFLKTRAEKAVNPLIQTTWNQSYPYWNQCPIYSGSNCYTGCVATAMAQLMKYHNHPATGTGSSSAYYTSSLGIYIPSVSYNVNYNFNNMGGATPTTSDAITNVARLMYHCGVSVQMNYTPTGSGAYSEDVGEAITNHFSYDKAIRFEERNFYKDAEWVNLLKQELDVSRPMYYSGRDDDNNGHAFICDGYNDQNLFHFNWGWGGSNNGYFSVTPMPSSYYPLFNAIYTGWKPNAGGTYTYQIYLLSGTNLTATKSVVEPLENFTASARFYNAGLWTFPGGTYAIGLFNNAGNLVEVIGNYSSSTELPPAYSFNSPFTINCQVPATVPAGNYIIKAMTKATGSSNWVIAKGTNIDQLPLQVLGDVEPCPTVSNLLVNYTGDCNKAVISWNAPAKGSRAVILNETFPNGTLPTGWNTLDADGDGYTWQFTIRSNDGVGGTCPPIPSEGRTDAYSINSASYYNCVGSLSPNNWLITPQLQLVSNSQLTYWVRAIDEDYASDHYGVYISTTGTNPNNFSLLYEETLTSANVSWTQRTLNIPQTGNCYIAFRHFNSHDVYVMCIDDIVVSTGGGTGDDYAYNVYRDNVKIAGPITATTFEDATFNNTQQHTWSVAVVCDNGEEGDRISVNKDACNTGPKPPVQNLQVSNPQSCVAHLSWDAPQGGKSFVLGNDNSLCEKSVQKINPAALKAVTPKNNTTSIKESLNNYSLTQNTETPVVQISQTDPASETRAALSYDIYCNSAKIGNTTSLTYNFTVPQTGNYNFCVVAIYEGNEESEQVCQSKTITCDQELCPTVSNLSVNYTGDCSKAIISWNAPGKNRATTLWDNTNIDYVNSGLISTYWGNDITWAWTADDFNATSAWTIEKIYSKGFSAGTSTPDAILPAKMAIAIYQDGGNKPGTEIYRNTNLSITDGLNPEMTLPVPFTLPGAGKYWIAIAGSYDSPVSTDIYRWNICYGPTPIGSNFHLQDDSGVFGIGSGWVDASTLISNPGASMYFKIEGAQGGSSTINYNVYRDGGKIAGPISATSFEDVTFNHTQSHTWSVETVCSGGETSEWVNVQKNPCELPTLTITATAGTNGTISPTGNVSVNYGANQTFNFYPNSGYHIDKVLVDNVNNPGAVASGNYTFTNVTANHTISVTFAINTYTITASSGGNGTISPNGTITVNSGANQTFTFTPNTGYHIDQVLIDNVNNPGAVASGSYTFTNVTANHSISVTFATNTYTITAVAGVNGTISPSGDVTVNHGENKTFTFTPNTGFQIADVLVDDVSNSGAVTNGFYIFSNVTANHTIASTFAIIDNITVNELDNIKVYSFQNSVYIENEMDVALKMVEILDMYGRLIYQGFISGEKTVIPLQVAEGIYNVKVISQEEKISITKVLIWK